jgi:hypothetical protein
MSIRWMTKVWSDSPYNGTRLILHLALADMAHDDGRFFASQTHLAQKARCTTHYVREVVNEMIANGWIAIITKGNSRGKATVYQLLIPKELPNSDREIDSELPNSDTPNSQTLTPQLPNSTSHHSSYTSVLSTTKSDETAIAVRPDFEEVAKRWWEKQTVKPLGKGAWHSLLKVCEAATKRGYNIDQIERALDYVGTVPTMRQMDLVLRGVGVKNRNEKNAVTAIELSEKLKDETI